MLPGAAIYFSESGGFKLRGVSKELYDSYLPEFLPYGAGIPTYVLREVARACRLSIQQDLDGGDRGRLRYVHGLGQSF